MKQLPDRISVSLSPSDVAAVHALATDQERSLSQIVRRIVHESLAAKQPNTEA